MTRLFRRVLERELADALSEGWVVVAEDYSPSVGRTYLLERSEDVAALNGHELYR